MNRTRNPQQASRPRDELDRDLHPDPLGGQNLRPNSESRDTPELTAFHLRTQGRRFEGLDDESLKQVPVVPEGMRLQQGATYVNLTEPRPREFTASGEMVATPGDAFVPKDCVAGDTWDTLTGKADRLERKAERDAERVERTSGER